MTVVTPGRCRCEMIDLICEKVGLKKSTVVKATFTVQQEKIENFLVWAAHHYVGAEQLRFSYQNILPYVCWTDCNYGMEPMLTVYTVVYDDQMLGIESCVGHVVSSRPNSKLYPQPSFFKWTNVSFMKMTFDIYLIETEKHRRSHFVHNLMLSTRSSNIKGHCVAPGLSC